MAKREVYNAIVTRNVDDDLGTDLRGGIFFEAPDIFDGEYPVPAYPCFQFASQDGAGFFFVPKVGDEIEIEMYVEDKTDPYDTRFIEVPEPRWRCMVYSTAHDIDDEFKENYPFRMGWKSNSGSIFLFDDTEGEELVRLAHAVGTKFHLDTFGNWIESIVRDKIQEVFGNRNIVVEKDDVREIYGNAETTIQKDETKKVFGNRSVEVDADSEHIIAGNHNFEAVEVTETLGSLTQNVSGAKVMQVDGGYKKIIGGSSTDAAISNTNKVVPANENVLVAGSGEATYGTGKKTTIALDNDELTLIAGNIVRSITAGNLEYQTLLGEALFGSLLGALNIDAAGLVTLGNPSAPGGSAISTLTDPIEDFITGKPKIGLPTITLK